MMEKILIVDDEKDTRDFMARALSGKYEVVTAADAELAMRQLESDTSIRLMLSDIRMPGEDGLTLMKAAKAARPWQRRSCGSAGSPTASPTAMSWI